MQLEGSACVVDSEAVPNTEQWFVGACDTKGVDNLSFTPRVAVTAHTTISSLVALLEKMLAT